jgi:hypothetical protein
MSDNNNEVWSKEAMRQIHTDASNDAAIEEATINVAANRQNKPLHKNSIARVVFLLISASAIGGGIYFLLNGGGGKKAVAIIQQNEKPPEAVQEDKGGWENAAEQSTSTGMGIDVDQQQEDKTKSDPSKLETIDKTKSDTKPDTTTASSTAATQPKAPDQPVIAPQKVVTAPSSPPVAAAPRQNSVVYTPPKPTPISHSQRLNQKSDQARIEELEAKLALAKEPKLIPVTPKSNDQTAKIKDLEAKLVLAKTSTPPVQTVVAPIARVAVAPKIQRLPALEAIATPSIAKIVSPPISPTRPISTNQPKLNSDQEDRIKKLEAKLAEVAMNARTDKKSVVDNLRPSRTEPIAEVIDSKTANIDQPPAPLISSTSVPELASKADVKPESKITTAPSLLSIDAKVEGLLIDSISGSATNESVGSPQVRIKLTGAIPTSNGGEIPINSIIAMNVKVSSQTGVVTGTSFGAWDTLGQPLDIPIGSLALESKSGLPLVAQAVALNKGAGDADTVASVWGAVGAGVDAVTRPDTNTTVTSGGAVVSSTNGGSRDFFTSALGGFARSKAQFEQQQALRLRAEAETQSKLWYIAKGSTVVISVRAPQPISQLNYRQFQAPQQPTALPIIPNQRPQIPQINQQIQQPYTPNGFPSR